MTAKSLPRRKLVARAFVIGVLFAKHGMRFCLGWLSLWLRRSGQGAAAHPARAGHGRPRPPAGRDLHQGRADHEHPPRPDPRVHLHRPGRAAGPRRPVPVRSRSCAPSRPTSAARCPSIFAEFAPVPIASASVAQVHKARLPDGRIVAVKVRRPDVVEICTFDLAVMRIWARAIARIPSISTLSPIEALEEFGNAVFAQLDFRVEAREQPPLPRQLQGAPRRRVPRGGRSALQRARPDDELHHRDEDPGDGARRAPIRSGWRGWAWPP